MTDATWQGTCEDCFHWNWDEDAKADNGHIIGPHCKIQSCECANSIMHQGKPTRFLSILEVPQEQGGLLGYEDEED